MLEENYGGEPLSGVVPQTHWDQNKATRRFTSARMLVYVRETAIDEVLGPLTLGGIPPHLSKLVLIGGRNFLAHSFLERMNEQRTEIDAKKKQKEQPNLFLTAKVVTDETFSRHEGFDLASFDERNSPLSDVPGFCVPNQMTYGAFKSRVATRFSYPENRIRFWVMDNRQNGTVRPGTRIIESQLSSSTSCRPHADDF